MPDEVEVNRLIATHLIEPDSGSYPVGASPVAELAREIKAESDAWNGR